MSSTGGSNPESTAIALVADGKGILVSAGVGIPLRRGEAADD